MIAETVLLTAAHCVDAVNHPGYSFGVFPGADASAYPTLDALIPALLPAKEAHAHPDYDPAPPFHADIGVVVLAAPIAVAPLPLNRDALSGAIAGEPARIIGYGQIVYGQYNAAKHAATTSVVGLGPDDTVVVGDPQHLSCVGDSGGPALVKIAGVETIVGVDSYTETTGCIEPASYRRTDSYLAFIDAYAPPPVVADAGADGGGGSAGAGGSAGTGGAPGTGGAGVVAAANGAGAGPDETADETSAPQASSGCAIAGSHGDGGPLLACLGLLLAAALRRRR